VGLVRDGVSKEREEMAEWAVQGSKKEGGEARSVCQLAGLLGFMEGEAGALFRGVAEAQKRSVRFGDRVRIELAGHVGSVDMCMAAATGEDVSWLCPCPFRRPISADMINDS
jgi:hypothetical protein